MTIHSEVGQDQDRDSRSLLLNRLRGETLDPAVIDNSEPILSQSIRANDALTGDRALRVTTSFVFLRADDRRTQFDEN